MVQGRRRIADVGTDPLQQAVATGQQCKVLVRDGPLVNLHHHPDRVEVAAAIAQVRLYQPGIHHQPGRPERGRVPLDPGRCRQLTNEIGTAPELEHLQFGRQLRFSTCSPVWLSRRETPPVPSGSAGTGSPTTAHPDSGPAKSVPPPNPGFPSSVDTSDSRPARGSG